MNTLYKDIYHQSFFASVLSRASGLASLEAAMSTQSPSLQPCYSKNAATCRIRPTWWGLHAFRWQTYMYTVPNIIADNLCIMTHDKPKHSTSTLYSTTAYSKPQNKRYCSQYMIAIVVTKSIKSRLQCNPTPNSIYTSCQHALIPDNCKSLHQRYPPQKKSLKLPTAKIVVQVCKQRRVIIINNYSQS